MTLQECRKIINDEQLINYNWFDEHEFKPNEVCIRKVKEKYVVFVTSERCSPMEDSIDEFIDESKALQSYIYRLRAAKRLFCK